MSGFADVLNELFPTDWLDPYGSMPLNKQYSVQIDITQVETDDGIKITAVKTPPRASTTSVQDAINMALGMGCCDDKEKGENCQSESKEKGENCQSESKEKGENCQSEGKAEKKQSQQNSDNENDPSRKESENNNEYPRHDNEQSGSGRQGSKTDRFRSS